MKTEEALALYENSVAKLAHALRISTAAIYQWGEEVPPLRAYQIRELQAGRTNAGCDCEHKEAA